MFQPHRAALATIWARDARVFASLYLPEDAPDAWEVYKRGVVAAYRQWGIEAAAHVDRLEREPPALFWLLHDLAGEVVGGIRVEGPYPTAARYAGLEEMSASPDLAPLAAELDAAAVHGLVEFKGTWGERPGYGRFLARCLEHSRWWLSAPYAFCTSADHARPAWESTGARAISGVAAAPYPDDRYRSIVLLWEEAYPERITPEQAGLLAQERRYLAPARARVAGDEPLAAWHPELLFDGADRLAELIDGGVEVVDRSGACGAELADLLPDVDDLVDEPRHWVYYPWRNTAVGLLGPAAHWRLRTDRNRYKLDDDEIAALRSRSVGVIGLSVGSSAAHLLAQEGLCGQLRIADFDHIESTNLNRLGASVLDLGSAKTHVAARRIAELDPYLSVDVFDDGITADNIDRFLAGLDAVVEECDSIDIKLLARQRAAALGIPVVMETCDRGLLDVERFDLDPGRLPFHGLVGDLELDELADLSTDDKVPHVLAILEANELSAPMAASMVEIDATTSTWPQLASDVALGSCLVAATLRRLFTGSAPLTSGRNRLDLDSVLDGLSEPAGDRGAPAPASIDSHPALPADFIAATETAASLAPSGGNMQPWRFTARPDRFEVEVDPASAVGMDIGLRGSAVACGAALANVVAVAAAAGRLGDAREPIDLALDADRPSLAGTVSFGAETDPDWAELAAWIPQRVSNRQHGPAEALDAGTIDDLRAVAERPLVGVEARLRYLPIDRIDEVVDAWAESDRVRYLTDRLHRELMGELRRPGHDDLSEGLDERTLELSDSDRAKLGVLRRRDVMDVLDRLDRGSRLGDDTRERLNASSGLVAVTVDGSTRADYVAGGAAFQRMWLAATKRGLWLQPVSPIFMYARSVEDLERVADRGRAATLQKMMQKTYTAFGCDPGEAFVLTARIHRGPAPTAVSRRRQANRERTGFGVRSEHSSVGSPVDVVIGDR